MTLSNWQAQTLKHNEIAHGFFGRRGGVSEGLYDSLNCGPGSNDKPDAVYENRRRVAHKMGVLPENLLSLNQIHSRICVPVGHAYPDTSRPSADALATDTPGLALGILTADCGPVLFVGTKADGAPVIGAAHAGWKGALNGVLESTVEMMRNLGAVQIQAALGPCIGADSYEVGAEFRQAFIEANEGNEYFFTAKTNDKYMFDMPAFILHRLRAADVEAEALNIDTYAHEDECFSYRRATHRNEDDYGREISVIVIDRRRRDE